MSTPRGAAAAVEARPVRATGGRVADRIRAAASWPALTGLALGLLALGPGLARGFILSYDMVFVPDPPFSTALLGLSGGPARAVPSDAVVAVLARVIPADILQKLILLAIFVAACAGAAALLGSGWQLVYGRQAPLLGRLAAGVYYAWNPFVAERLLIGQWAMLLGYAGLPWVLRLLATGPVRIRPLRLVLVLLPAAIGGFAAMAITGLAAVPVALARGTRRERVLRTGVLIAALAVVSLPWLVPSLIVPVHADPAGVRLFAARADTPFGRLGSLVALSGIWNSQTVPRGYGGLPAVCWLAVVAVAVAGYLLRARRDRLCPGLGAAGLVGLAVAAIGITPATRSMLADLESASAGFAILRDGQQFVAALGLMESVGFGAAVCWLLGRQARPAGPDRARPDRVGLGRAEANRAGPDRAGPDRAGAESAGAGQPGPAAAVAGRPAAAGPAGLLAVLAVLAPILLLPGLAWGVAGRLHAVQYPADWQRARQLVDDDPQPGSVLLLPWGVYRRYRWNDGEAVFDPWPRLLGRDVIASDGLQIGRYTLAQESTASIKMNRLLAQPGPITGRLRADGVRFVIIDAGPLLMRASTGSPAALAAAARLPGARLLLASGDLLLFRLR